MSDSRILILEGYDASPLGAHTRESSRQRAWCATKVGRKTNVALGDASCSGKVVHARTKKQAKAAAVAEFRAERGSRKSSRKLGAATGPQSAAQRRFAAAAHACAVNRTGKNRSYLSCMRQQLTK